jgi:hypothetical protein
LNLARSGLNALSVSVWLAVAASTSLAAMGVVILVLGCPFGPVQHGAFWLLCCAGWGFCYHGHMQVEARIERLWR